MQNPCSAVRATHFFYFDSTLLYGGFNLEQDNSESVITTIFSSPVFGPAEFILMISVRQKGVELKICLYFTVTFLGAKEA